MNTSTPHPTDEALRAYGLGRLDDAPAASVHSHLEGCPECRRRVAEITSDSFLDRLRDAKARPESLRPAVSSTDGLSMLDRGPAPAAPPPAGALPPGMADLPNYEILRELGQGGMGTVFLARNTLMGRMEVLKVVSGHLVDRGGILDRFLGEIRNAARLHHPNIVAAYTAHQLGESLVLAMEYVEGLDLSRLVKAKGPLPVANACSYVHHAALGLQHAHEHGMVHRDIKPSNLMLAKQGNRGVVKVLDFGLAKVTSEGAVDGGLTHEGQMLGTPDYIAPEQISNARRADIRADIYSLGCTLYYLLTGKPPFRGDSLYDILQAHHSMDATQLNLVRPEVPVEVAAIVAKMMAKEPARRFQEPKEVAQALKPFFKSGNVAVQRQPPELSRTGQTGSGRPAPGLASTPTHPATLDEGPVVRPNLAAEPSAPVVPWQSLIDTGPTERSRGATSALAPMRRRPWFWPSVAVGALLLGLLIAWGVVIRVKTTDGMIELVNLPKDAEVLVDGKEVAVTWPGGGKPAVVTVVPGKHKVMVTKDEFETSGDEVTVQAGGIERITLRFVPLAASPEVKDNANGAGQVGKMLSEGRPVIKPEAPVAAASDPSLGSITNSIGMKLALLPGGEFRMGAPDGDTHAHPIEKPQHPVRLSPFYIGINEVTQAQYEAVTGKNPSHFSSRGAWKDRVAGRTTADFPVENVSWVDAALFCNALSEKEGRTPFYQEGAATGAGRGNGPGYRLPTEAEWEYACRARANTRYCFGDDAWILSKYAGTGAMPHPVGESAPNGFGLYDMHGNVWEWCSDWFGPETYKQSPLNDPTGPLIGNKRIYRGGAWDSDPIKCTSTYREKDPPQEHFPVLGFRVAIAASARLQDLPASVGTARQAPRPAGAAARSDTGKGDSPSAERLDPTPARPGANAPAQIQAIDAALALRGKAEILDGRWLVEGSQLVRTDTDGGGVVLFGDLHWTDYDFTVDLMRDLMREKFNGNAMLIFRRSSPDRNLEFEISAGDRNVEVSGITAREDRAERGLKSVNIRLVDHKWYHARVSVRRNHIVCTLHDDRGIELVHLDPDDDRHPTGQVGLSTYNSSYRFKNIKVTAPDGSILWEMPPAIGEPPRQPGGEKNVAAERTASRPAEKPADPAAVAAGPSGDLLPAGDSGHGAMWAYTTTEPGPKWADPDFDDSKWPRGRMGFGVPVNGMVVWTPLKPGTVWLRARVTIPALASDQRLKIHVCHASADLESGEAPKVFVDGRLAYSFGGWVAPYDDYPLGPAQMALFRPGEHVIAVRAIQVDLGLGLARRDEDGPFRPLFHGSDLTDWQGPRDCWRLEDGVLTGSPPAKNPKHTSTNLVSRAKYRDFELRFKARLKDGVGYGGVPFRAGLRDEKLLAVAGYQCRIAGSRAEVAPGSIVSLGPSGLEPQAPRDLISQIYRDEDFNEFSIRCVGKRVTSMVNGFVVLHRELPGMLDEGYIAWQLHGGVSPREVTFKDVEIRVIEAGRPGRGNGLRNR